MTPSSSDDRPINANNGCDPAVLGSVRATCGAGSAAGGGACAAAGGALGAGAAAAAGFLAAASVACTSLSVTVCGAFVVMMVAEI